MKRAKPWGPDLNPPVFAATSGESGEPIHWDHERDGCPHDAWHQACSRASEAIEGEDSELYALLMREAARTLTRLANVLAGAGCRRCGGLGRRVYPDGSTWRRGASGQQLTEDTCDECWGTGRTDEVGRDLRKLAQSTGREVEGLVPLFKPR